MVTKNLATQIDIYNGATGTVVGLGFHLSLPDKAFTAINKFHSLINRELPQSMTAHNGIVYEPSNNSPFTRDLPHVALSRATDLDKVSLLSAIRKDHFIANKFMVENETIAILC